MESFKCLRCGHEWRARSFEESGEPVKPARCAGCKRKYWWKPKRITARAVDPTPRGIKYPQVCALDIGESVLIPWPIHGTDSEILQERARINPAVRSIAQVRGWEFITEGTASGLLVRRLS